MSDCFPGGYSSATRPFNKRLPFTALQISLTKSPISSWPPIRAVLAGHDSAGRGRSHEISLRLERDLVQEDRCRCGKTERRSGFDAASAKHGQMKYTAVALICIAAATSSSTSCADDAVPAKFLMVTSCMLGDGTCSTLKAELLVFAVEHGPPYLKGAAIRRNLQADVDERIYSSEKLRLKWLCLSGREMLVVIPNIGHETDKEYLVYQYVAGKRQPDESMATDKLPVSTRALLPAKLR